MKVNWCASCGRGNNFGDQLGPRLLDHFGVGYEFAPADQADLITVGSILSKVPNGWRGTVLGSGFIAAGIRRDLRNARVLALRGELTRAASRMSVKVPVYGDPGILAPLLWEAGPHEGGLVIAPHYVDHEMIRRYPDARVADVTGDPAEFVRAITSADRVVTSSLHALITADAYDIPHAVEPHEKVKGGLFKFLDYASAFEERVRPGRFRVTPRPAMAARQRTLADLFAQL